MATCRQVIKSFCSENEDLFHVLVGEKTPSELDKHVFNVSEIAKGFILILKTKLADVQEDKLKPLIERLEEDNDVLSFIPQMIQILDEEIREKDLKLPEIPTDLSIFVSHHTVE